MKLNIAFAVSVALLIGSWLSLNSSPTTAQPGKAAAAKARAAKYDPTAAALAEIAKLKVGKHDWPQWSGWGSKNNTPYGKNIPIEWDVKTGGNIKWKAKLGSQTYGNAVVANGKIFVGTNNEAGYLKRYPIKVDLGCLLCFDEKTGQFLWQHSSPKLAAGRVNDWPEQGICDAPYVDGDRVWFVTSRGEVICLDTNGFHDNLQNDGPFNTEAVIPKNKADVEGMKEADVVWKFDMMGTLGSFQHNMCACSVTIAGDILFVATGNGHDATHINLPAPNAPSFFALNKTTGKLLWKDKSPGENILHGQWSSPTYAVLNGVPQVLFAGGDGWLYSFDPKGTGKDFKSKLLWKFDCNPKESKWVLGGRGTRNNLIATPVVYDGLVYIAVGQDPIHGEQMGHLYCIKPPVKADGSDVSPFLAVDAQGKPVPHRRLQAINIGIGEKAIKNPKSAMVWHYGSWTAAQFAKKPFEKQMHRSCGTVAIKNDILYIADFSGLVHCLNAKTGKAHWTYDMFAASWGSPLIVEGRVYIGDEDGDIAIFPLTADPKKALKKDKKGEFRPALGEIEMHSSVYTTPIVANNVLYIATRTTLFAISAGGK
ncbi:MAG: PQQ-binding-like beta-propeller repeat protein [Planctomycetes bacterium]|nr:PQQ-binding-like beta-propeller repeat protein [Planctomycetota bacterium]